MEARFLTMVDDFYFDRSLAHVQSCIMRIKDSLRMKRQISFVGCGAEELAGGRWNLIILQIECAASGEDKPESLSGCVAA